MSDRDSNFLSRWSRRKAQVREGLALPDEVAPAPPTPAVDVAPASASPPVPVTRPTQAEMAPRPAAAPPAPTLSDVAILSPQSDYTRFLAEGVTPEVKNAALKKLFADPHFNVMDGLDTYIDDYGKPDPLPAGMLRKMAQSHLLGLFDDEQKVEAASVSPEGELDAPSPTPVADDQADAPPGAAADAAPH
jgi:hypothetical protein